jgi:hypothetical protein
MIIGFYWNTAGMLCSAPLDWEQDEMSGLKGWRRQKGWPIENTFYWEHILWLAGKDRRAAALLTVINTHAHAHTHTHTHTHTHQSKRALLTVINTHTHTRTRTHTHTHTHTHPRVREHVWGRKKGLSINWKVLALRCWTPQEHAPLRLGFRV